MVKRILVPWAMPEIGKEVLRKVKAEIILIHGPKGELSSAHGGRLVLLSLVQKNITFYDPDFDRRELTLLTAGMPPARI
jgi:hypothetical protein